MGNLWNSIRIRPPKSNRFNLSHDVKQTMKFGVITPIMCVPTLPGDVFKLNTEILCRFAPMKAPIMHKINVYTHFFYIPSRLLWSHWKDFITGGEDGTSSPSYPRLKINANTNQLGGVFSSGSLADYLGFPVVNSGAGVYSGREIDIDALPFRAYQLVYNEYYRDQNVTDPVDIGKDMDGVIRDVRELMSLRNRSWKKDYFTSALPWAQRGEEVSLPLQGTAPIKYPEELISTIGVSELDSIIYPSQPDYSTSSPLLADEQTNLVLGLEDRDVKVKIGTRGGVPYGYVRGSDLESLAGVADLSKASASTINELRRAIKAQEFLELSARGGSRYIEQIYSYFGVRSSDARLQRPEFLGGGKSAVMINDVLQTSQTTDSSPLATPSGHAVGVQNTHSFKYRCEEHGYILGLMTVMPDPSYQQGLPRVFQKFDRLDYYWPQFAHLGEQEILQSELYVDMSTDGNGANANETFGYAPRYSEYKYIPNSVHGDFRDTLNFWHMGRIFSGPPRLNDSFLTNMSAADRPFAVTDSGIDKIWVNIHHNFKALRLMPKYGSPLF